MMYPLFVHFSSTILATPLEAVDDQTLLPDLGDLRLPSQTLNPSFTSNTITSLLNTSVSNDISIQSDSKEYGFNHDVDNCTSALLHQLVGRRDQIRTTRQH